MLEAQSRFQRIKIVPDRKYDGEVKLFLDDLFQLSTYSEFKYHESLITIPMCAAPNIDRVLICGGGDGMSLREALRFPYCKPTMVELDAGMIAVWRDMPEYAKYNNDSMKDSRAHILTGDARKFLNNPAMDGNNYDLIAWDFPGGDDDGNLYSIEVLNQTINSLSQNGVFTTHVSVPLSKMIKLVMELKKRDFYVWYFDAFYDVDGNHDSFIVASKRYLSLQRPVPEGCRWANEARVKVAFSDGTEINSARISYFINFLDQEMVDE